jgi:hypothetical protein
MESSESPEKYEMLWVEPAAGVANVPSRDELEAAISDLSAHVMPGVSLERQKEGQTAVRLFQRSDKATVRATIEGLHYDIVEEATRPVALDAFIPTDW